MSISASAVFSRTVVGAPVVPTGTPAVHGGVVVRGAPQRCLSVGLSGVQSDGESGWELRLEPLPSRGGSMCLSSPLRKHPWGSTGLGGCCQPVVTLPMRWSGF